MSTKKNGNGKAETKSSSAPVVETKPGSVVELPDYGQDAGIGTEQLGALQRAPIMVLLQLNSPQVQPGPKNVPGAKGGMFWNPQTNELIPGETGFVFVPAYYKRMCVEWNARTAGGGFVAAQPWTKALMSEGKQGKNDRGKVKFGTRVLPNNIERVDTHYLIGFVVNEDEEAAPSGMVVLSMTSTKVAALQQWSNRFFHMKLPNGKAPPLFAGLVRVTSRWESKNQGYFAIVLEPAIDQDYAKSLLSPTSSGYQAGKQLHEAIERKEVEILYETAPDEDQDESDSAVPPPDGKRPF